MQVVVCVMTLAVGLLRQAVLKVAAVMWPVSSLLAWFTQLPVLYSLPCELSQLVCANAAIASASRYNDRRFWPVSSRAVREKALICHFLVVKYIVLASRWESCRNTSRRQHSISVLYSQWPYCRWQHASACALLWTQRVTNKTGYHNYAIPLAEPTILWFHCHISSAMHDSIILYIARIVLYRNSP